MRVRVMSEVDDFVVYLDRRTNHTKKKLEKVALYKTKDVSELSDQQLSTIELELETQGKMLEITSVREQYERYAQRRTEQVQAATQESYERGRREALSDIGASLAVASNFLSFMSQAYKSGTAIDSSKSMEGFYKLLELFYAGGRPGGDAMSNLVLGSSEPVAEGYLSFEDVKKKLEEVSIADSEAQMEHLNPVNEATKGDDKEVTPQESETTSEASPEADNGTESPEDEGFEQSGQEDKFMQVGRKNNTNLRKNNNNYKKRVTREMKK